MEIIQLCENCTSLHTGGACKLSGSLAGPMPVHIYSVGSEPFVGTVQLEGTISTGREIESGTAKWSVLSGATWTIETIDAIFVQVTHIRVKVSEYISGAISVRLGF